MLQNYFEEKIVELYIRERLFVKKMHQKKANAETLCKIWFVPFVPWLPSSMSNHDGKWVFYDYHIYIYIYIDIHIHCGAVFFGQVYSERPWTWQEMRPVFLKKLCSLWWCDGVLVRFQHSRSLALLIFNFFSQSFVLTCI